MASWSFPSLGGSQFSAGSLKECWVLAVCWGSTVACGGLIDLKPTRSDANVGNTGSCTSKCLRHLRHYPGLGSIPDAQSHSLWQKPPLGSYTATGSSRSLVTLPTFNLTIMNHWFGAAEITSSACGRALAGKQTYNRSAPGHP